MFFRRMLDFADMPFDFQPGNQHLVPAAFAFEPEIHADPQHGEAAASAGMGLFELQPVADPHIQSTAAFLRSLDISPRS